MPCGRPYCFECCPACFVVEAHPIVGCTTWITATEDPDVKNGFVTLFGLDQFQELAHQTAAYPDPEGPLGSFYVVAGLAAEVGEVAGKYAKQVRDAGSDFADPEFREAIKKELGDVLWFVQELAGHLDLSLSEVAQANLRKLHDRKRRGVIAGSGDDR